MLLVVDLSYSTLCVVVKFGNQGSDQSRVLGVWTAQYAASLRLRNQQGLVFTMIVVVGTFFLCVECLGTFCRLY